MPLNLRHFWAALILVTAANATIWWFRGREHRRRDPSLTEGYRSLVGGLLLWGNLPWLVMGSGVLIGAVPTTLDYLNPRSGNPFVLAWCGSVLLLWVVGTYWLLNRGGAEQLFAHPGLFRRHPKSPAAIKVSWGLFLAAAIGAILMMLTMDLAPRDQ